MTRRRSHGAEEADGAGIARGHAPKVSRRPASLAVAVAWFLSSYGGAVLGYVVVNAIASRFLGDQFGYFVIATSVTMVAGQLGLVGVHRGGLREVARLSRDDTHELAPLRQAVRAASLVTLPLTALIGGLTAGLASGGGRTGWIVAVLVALLIWLSGQQKLWANYLRGFGYVRLSGLVSGRSGGTFVAVSQAACLALVWWLLPESGLAGALFAMVVGFALPVAVAWRTVWQIWHHVVPERIRVRALAGIFSRYRHFAFIMVLGPLNVHVELWLAGVLLDAADTSLYSAANRMAALLQVLGVTLAAVYAPVVARLYDKDRDRLERLLRTGATLSMVPTALLWLPMLIWPGWVMESVFGDGFAAGAPLLVIMTVGTMTNMATGLCMSVLTMTDHESAVVGVQAVAVPIRLVAALTLGGLFGVVGLSISAGAVTTLSSLALWWTTLRRTGLKTHPTLRPQPRLLLREDA